MTILTWLDSRTPESPSSLRTRILEALGDRADLDAAQAPTACLDAALMILQDLVREDPIRRDRAGELLAADALVTYAFEAVAERSDLDTFADLAMTQLAELASGERAAGTRE